MKILQESPGIDPRGPIEFDEYERNAYVARFLEIFKADLHEHEMCAALYAIHQEICSNYDLYIAVADRLESGQRRALHTYASRGWQVPQPDSFCNKRLCDGEPCMLVAEHGGECMALPF